MKTSFVFQIGVLALRLCGGPGAVSYALRDLTGGAVRDIDLRSTEWEGHVVTDRLWHLLRGWIAPQTSSDDAPSFLVGCMWTRTSVESAMQGGTTSGTRMNAMHAVLSTVEVKQTRLLKVSQT